MVPAKILGDKPFLGGGELRTSLFVLTKKRERKSITLKDHINILSFVCDVLLSNATKIGILNFATKTCIHQQLTGWRQLVPCIGRTIIVLNLLICFQKVRLISSIFETSLHYFLPISHPTRSVWPLEVSMTIFALQAH